MKTIFKAALMLILPLAAACSHEQEVTVNNESKTPFYVMTAKEARYITKQKVYELETYGDIEHIDTLSSITHVNQGSYLQKFKTDSTFVFCFVPETAFEKPLKGKSRVAFETVSIPLNDAEHITSVKIMVKDSVGKPAFSSTVKYKQGI